ncbi:MAG: PEP-CTERM sorting domain-containing protein [Pirellulales bacterium]
MLGAPAAARLQPIPEPSTMILLTAMGVLVCVTKAVRRRVTARFVGCRPRNS